MMATFLKGGSAPELFGAQEMAAKGVPYAVYPFWAGALVTRISKNRPRPATRAVVVEIGLGGSTTPQGNVVFFQTAMLNLPQRRWSVGVVVAPDKEAGRTWYDFPYPDISWDGSIEKAMALLPEEPELPGDEQEPFPEEPAAQGGQPGPAVAEDEPF